MHPIRTTLLLLVLLALPLGARTLAAQNAAVDSTWVALGAAEGGAAAETTGTGIYTASGFVGGLVLGPIGTALTYTLAAGSGTAPDEDLAEKIEREDRGYLLGFQQAYADRLRSRRKRSALLGGATGTALLGVLTYGAYLHLR